MILDAALGNFLIFTILSTIAENLPENHVKQSQLGVEWIKFNKSKEPVVLNPYSCELMFAVILSGSRELIGGDLWQQQLAEKPRVVIQR